MYTQQFSQVFKKTSSSRVKIRRFRTSIIQAYPELDLDIAKFGMQFKMHTPVAASTAMAAEIFRQLILCSRSHEAAHNDINTFFLVLLVSFLVVDFCFIMVRK